METTLKSGDEVIIGFGNCNNLRGIIVEFAKYNDDGHECYWVKLKSGDTFNLPRDDLSRNNSREYCFWIGFLTPTGAKEKIEKKLYGIAIFCQENYK